MQTAADHATAASIFPAVGNAITTASPTPTAGSSRFLMTAGVLHAILPQHGEAHRAVPLIKFSLCSLLTPLPSVRWLPSHPCFLLLPRYGRCRLFGMSTQHV
eukprot:3477139-Pleurochrysis_carterae.AAC.1